MLGLDDYGSDSDTEQPKKSPQLAPQPAKKTQRPPKRIAISLPAIKDSPDDEREDTERPAKRQKTGVGVSSLLTLLPTPKQANPSLPATSPSLPYASSAPTLPTFEPPEPTPTDPYPGYYQRPSGAWAAYDSEYYAEFMKKWRKEYDAQVRALEKGVAKGFEGFEDSTLSEVDAKKEMERAKKEIQEREERKAVTMGAGGGPAAPRMTMTASKQSGIARSRHQLSTLLKEAYENREALEERIAQGKRNRKEAGNKYGF